MTSWRRLIYIVLKASDLRCLEDVQFTTSWRHLEDVWYTTSWRCLIYSVLKKSNLSHLKTSNLRRLEDVWFKTFWGRLIYNVLKTSYLCCLEDVQFTTSWGRLIYNVFKTSVKQRLCSHVVLTSIQQQRKQFFLILYCLKYSENFKCSCLG